MPFEQHWWSSLVNTKWTTLLYKKKGLNFNKKKKKKNYDPYDHHDYYCVCVCVIGKRQQTILCTRKKLCIYFKRRRKRMHFFGQVEHNITKQKICSNKSRTTRRNEMNECPPLWSTVFSKWLWWWWSNRMGRIEH